MYGSPWQWDVVGTGIVSPISDSDSPIYPISDGLKFIISFLYPSGIPDLVPYPI